MTRVLRTLLITLGVVCSLLVSAAVAVILFLDDDGWRRIAAYAVERLTGRILTVDGSFAVDLSLEPSLVASHVRVDNPSWATQADFARIGRLEVQVALRPLLSGILVVPRLILEDAHFDLETGADGARNWTTAEAAEDADANDDGDDGFLVPVLGTVMLRNVAWRYRDATTGRESSIELDHVTFKHVGDVARLDGEGLWDGRKIGAQGQFGTLAEALHPTTPFPLDVRLSLPGLDVALQGTVTEPATGQGVDLHVSGHSDDVSQLLGVLGSDLAVVGRLAGDAKVGGDLAALEVADLSLSLVSDEGRESEPSVAVTGRIGNVRPGGATPLQGIDLKVQIATSTANLSSWLGRRIPDLGPVDGQFALTGDARALKVSGAQLQIGDAKRLTIAATGGVETIQLAPDLTVEGIGVHLQAEAPTTAALVEALGHALPELGAVAASGRLSGGLDQLDLEDVDLTAGTTHRPIRVTGRIDNLLFGQKAPASLTFESALTPLLDWWRDGQLPELGQVRASAQVADVGGDLQLEQVQIVADDTDTLSVKATSVAGQAASNNWPELDVDITAKDLTILGTLLDRSIPPLGPFAYEGRLRADPETTQLSGKARLGQTEIEADITASFEGARPDVSGKLSTPVLHLADVGIRPDRPWEDAETAEPDSSPPDTGPTPLSFAPLQALDLSLLVQIDQLEGVQMSVDRGTIAVTLKDGVLRIDPARFDYVGGSFSIDGTVDSLSDPPEIELEVVADDVLLGKVFAQVDKVVPIDGELDMQLSLKSAGSTLQDLTSSLQGTLDMAIARGTIYVKLFDLTGANLLHWLLAGAITKGGTDLRCFVAQLDTMAGVAKSKALLLETSLTISKGIGTINLVEETIDISVRPHSRGAHLEVTTPYRIYGPWSDPSVDYSKVGLVVRTVAEVVMLPIHTLEALVPLLIDGGKDQDNPCLKWAPAPTAATIGSGTGGFPMEDLAPAPYVATTASHVREGPGTTHPVIETLAEGATVQVTGQAAGLDWYRVSLADGGVGYVWDKLLEPAQPGAQ